MITHDFQGHLFECYTRAEFTALGLRRRYEAVSNTFVPSEGLLLKQWLRNYPDALLVTNGKELPRITVYAPKQAVKIKTRALRRRSRCGAGEAQLEDMSGALSDRRAFYDVLAACRRKLKEWEDAGVLTTDRADKDFTF